MNPYNFYKIGDNFHNDNGEVYFIIALDKKKDKAILGKVAADGTPFYIGAQGLGMTSWNYGHYFMQNIFAAIDWYKGDSEQEESDSRPYPGTDYKPCEVDTSTEQNLDMDEMIDVYYKAILNY